MFSHNLVMFKRITAYIIPRVSTRMSRVLTRLSSASNGDRSEKNKSAAADQSHSRSTLYFKGSVRHLFRWSEVKRNGPGRQVPVEQVFINPDTLLRRKYTIDDTSCIGLGSCLPIVSHTLRSTPRVLRWLRAGCSRAGPCASVSGRA